MAYEKLIYVLSVPLVSDNILSYTFSLTTLQSLFNICEKNEKYYPSLNRLQYTIRDRFNIIAGKSYFLFNAHDNAIDSPCHYCGQTFGGNNFFHYSQHITSISKCYRTTRCQICQNSIKYHTT